MKLSKAFLLGLVVFVMASAAIGIFSVLSGSLGETQTKILLTTVSLGGYSLAGLCCSSVLDRPKLRGLARFGVGVSILGGGFAVLTNWELISGWELVLRGRFSLLILAISLAHVCLLMRIETEHSTVRSVRRVTVFAIAVVSLLLLGVTGWPTSAFASWPVLIAFGILDVAGTIITPLLHVAVRKESSG